MEVVSEMNQRGAPAEQHMPTTNAVVRPTVALPSLCIQLKQKTRNTAYAGQSRIKESRLASGYSSCSPRLHLSTIRSPPLISHSSVWSIRCGFYPLPTCSSVPSRLPTSPPSHDQVQKRLVRGVCLSKPVVCYAGDF